MEIGGINSLYTDYVTSSAENSRVSSLADKSENDYSNASDEELMDVCKQFESYFLEQVFDAMLDTAKVFSDDEDNSYASKMVDYFKDTAIQEISSQATEQSGLGIAQTLYEQMKRQYSGVNPETLESAAASAAKTEQE